MRRRILLLILSACSLSAAHATPVNQVVGDYSFVWKYGHFPAPQEEHLRVATHLEYAEFILRSADVSHLSSEEQQNRDHALDLLHEYWTRGVFPVNADYANERRPCFIDNNGTICAVGYLVEQTAGRLIAEEINDHHRYDRILQMNDPLVYEWLKSSGLTREECALIQPEYTEPVKMFSAGMSYRIADRLYPTVHYHMITASWRSTDIYYDGLNAQLTWLYGYNFEAGAGVQYVMDRMESEKFHPFWGLQPNGFHYDATWGMNLRPEVGIILDRGCGPWSLTLNYGYEIPIIASRKYGAGRHDLTLRIGFIPKRSGSSRPTGVKF